MMKQYGVWFFSTFLVLMSISQLSASHFMGGDITYECLGGTEYKVSLTIYRDCNSATAFQQFAALSLSGVDCPGFQVFSSVELQPTYPRIITPLCEQEVDLCESQDGTYGVQQYLYEGIYTVPEDCQEIRVSYSDCCRNTAISTLIEPQTEDFYIGGIINTLDANCNSSPKFNNTPTPFSCVGQEVNYNHGVTDDDGDDLVFSLVNCFDGPNDGVEYLAPYSGVNPLDATDLSIDPATGAITFIPNALQVGVLCVLVEEFRNGVKIGEIVRDIQFTVLNCSSNTIDENVLPVLSGIDGVADMNGTTGDFEMDVCLGIPLCFDMNAFDVDGHNLELSWNQGIPDGSFSINGNGTTNAGAEFCWTPVSADIGLNFFTVTVMDDACDIRGVNTYTFTLNVSDGGVDYTVNTNEVSCNGGNDGSASLNVTTPLDNPSYEWPTIPIQTGTSATNLSAGTYFVTLTDSSLDCDFAVLEVDVGESEALDASLAGASGQVSCQGGNDGVLEIQLDGGSGPFTYNWSNGPSNAMNSDLMAGNYTVTVTDNLGCTTTASFEVTQPDALVLNATTSDYNGFGVSCTGGDDGEIDLEVAGGTIPYTYNWSNGAISENNTNITAGTYTVTVTDFNGCSDSLVVGLNQPTVLQTQLNNIPTTCFESSDGSIVIEGMSGAVPPYSWSLNGEDYIMVDTFPIIIPNQTRGQKEIFFLDAVGCIYPNLIEVASPDSLTVEILPDDVFLDLGDEVDISFLTNSTDSFDFVWTATYGLECDTCAFFTHQPLQTTGFTLSLTEKTTGCQATGNAIIRVVEDDFVFVPNIFTPNDDGFNDRLSVYVKKDAVTRIISFRVFNRWGGQVYSVYDNFDVNDINVGWDGIFEGKRAPSGVYVYAVEVEYINGKIETFSGDVTLVR